MNLFKNIGVTILILAGFKLSAQSLQGIQENMVIKKHLAEHPVVMKSLKNAALLSLPFFEDFSNPSVFPDPVKWADRDAFVNNSFAIDPVSVGVVTLDAIDENGDVYALSNSPASSDRLTSQDFDLSYYASSNDTVRLSFFYQCGGNGEVPELSDSLLLEFYSPINEQWEMVWFVTLNEKTGFEHVIMEVPSVYYQSGFRFRFRNYTSLSANDVRGGKGALSNADCWNIDYILLNTDPVSTHQSINDVTLMDPPRKLMSFYEIIPWKHLNEAQSITRNFMNYAIRNMDYDSASVLRSYTVKDFQTGQVEFYKQYLEGYGPDTVIRRNDPFFAPFTRSDNSNEGIIEVINYLITPVGQNKQNDTAKITLHFKDYYAFDDGTPEYGFGIEGPSMAGALLAYRFRVFKPDTLRAIEMLFNKARDNFNLNLGFHLCVWKDEGGKPGDLIFMSNEEYSPGLGIPMPGGFKRYVLNTEEEIIITDTAIYVGWKQVTGDFLNLGYDVNRNNLERTFVNTSGDWNSPGGSFIAGSLMMRAVFGNKQVITGDEEVSGTTEDVLLFPNPVNDRLTIQSNRMAITHISILDLSGRLVIQKENLNNLVDVSVISPGIYQVILITDKNQQITRKIVVSH